MIRAIPILLLTTFPAMAETLVATRVVRPNTIISAADYAVAETAMPGALAAGADIAGLEAKVTLYPGRPILPAHVGPAALVKRNQPITLIYRRGRLSISTEGRALSRGAVGDTVNVMNMASRSTVSGRVLSDGSVAVSSQGDAH